MPFSLTNFFRSLQHARSALAVAFREEQNFRLHVFAAFVVFVVAWALRVSWVELGLLMVVVGQVLILELVNSAVERLVDMAQPRVHQYAAVVKNMMAGAVLLAALVAVGVGSVVFLPRLVAYFGFVL